MKSVTLRNEPTVREADAILARLEDVLAGCGVEPKRRGLELRFRVPAPWRATRLGLLLAATSGVVKVSAGAGEPWRVRFGLDFTVLRAVAVVLSIAVTAIGLGWPRLTLVNALVAIWVFCYLLPRWAADRRLDALVRESAVAVLDRRRTPRDVPVV